MNKENILKLAEHIEKLPPDRYRQLVFSRCGLPQCIAGHALDLSGDWDWRVERWNEDKYLAQYWLGLSDVQADALFAGEPVGMGWTEPSVDDAASTLRHLAETGEVDWGRARR